MKKDTNTPALTLKLNKLSLRPLQTSDLAEVAAGGNEGKSVRELGCNILSAAGVCR